MIFLFPFFLTTIYAQNNIYGKVINKNNTPVSLVNIVLKNKHDSILKYTFTNIDGEFNFKTKNKGKVKLTFSSLGYETINITKFLDKDISISVKLKDQPFTLNEVIITNNPIKVKKDTIVFTANRFLKQSDVTVEDLLKNIPGVNIDSDGNIKIGNQEIDRLLIDGDDFFEKGYKILSKNMPPEQVEKVEILQKYSHNKLLKNIEYSDKKVINLKLKKDTKRKWFGNISLGQDINNKNKHSFKNYLMSFNSKNKYIILSDFNNLGTTTNSINQLLKSNYINTSAYSFINEVNSIVPYFKTERVNFNNSKFVSLNNILKINNKIKLKTNIIFKDDTNYYIRNIKNKTIIDEYEFNNTETINLNSDKFDGLGKLDFSYDISKSKTLEIVTRYNNQNESIRNTVDYNTLNTYNLLNNEKELFDLSLSFTNKYKKNKVLLTTLYYKKEKTPQHFYINNFLYNTLFENESINNIIQKSENNMQFIGFESHIFNRIKNKNLLELKIGNKFRKDLLSSSLSLLENSTKIDNPLEYQNKTNYLVNNSYFKIKYLYKTSNLTFTGKLNFHTTNSRLNNYTTNNFYVNPNINILWKINKNNKLTSTFSHNTRPLNVKEIYPNYILTSLHSFNKGTDEFQQLSKSSYSLNYELGNWTDRFFANLLINYNINHDFLTYNSSVSQNYSQNNLIKISNLNSLSFLLNTERYFKSIKSNLKLSSSLFKNHNKNIYNSSLIKSTTTNYINKIELKSGFQSFLNYHIGSKWITNNIKTTTSYNYTNNISFIDLFIDINDKFNIQLQSERYYFDKTNRTKNTYFFFDTKLKYLLKKNLVVTLHGNNLLNIKNFSTFYTNNIITSITQYRLLPRSIIFKIQYRF